MKSVGEEGTDFIVNLVVDIGETLVYTTVYTNVSLDGRSILGYALAFWGGYNSLITPTPAYAMP